MAVSVILTSFNRPKALARVFETLARTSVPIHLFIQDDGSSSETTNLLLQSSEGLGFPVSFAPLLGRDGGDPNRARRRSLYEAFEGEWDDGSDFVVTIESDLVFHPHWLKFLMKMYEVAKQSDGSMLVDGHHLATLSAYRGWAHRANEIISQDGWVYRRLTGGVNHLITRWWYEKGKEPQGWMSWEKREGDDWVPRAGGWDFMMARQAKSMGLLFGCLMPSLVDHVPGDEGTTSGSKLVGDRALDFPGEWYGIKRGKDDFDSGSDT